MPLFHIVYENETWKNRSIKLHGLKVHKKMSGIAGIISLHSVHPREKAHSMLSWCRSKASVSPEESETHLHQNACIGVMGCKLANSQDKSVFVAFCGEFLRKERLIDAIKKKSPPYFENDLQLLLLGYETLGSEVFSHLDGDFAIMILDTKKNEMYIARDRMGTYDLFWHASPHAIVFSSSLKAILSTGFVSISPDAESIATYLSLGYISQDKTPIQGINRLLPGYYLQISLGGKVSIHPFWSLSSCFSKSKWKNFESSENLYEELSQKIFNSLDRRQKLEYPLAGIFSGSQGANVLEHFFLKNVQTSHIPTLSVHFESFDPALKSQNYTFSSLQNAAPHAQILIIPKMFFKTIIPSIWTTEVPIADLDALPCWNFINWCHTHNLTAYFDTGFHEEFYNYASHLPQMFREGQKQNEEPGFIQHMQKALYSFLIQFFPALAFKIMRRSQTQDIRLNFLENESVIPRDELTKASPALAKLFEPDLFLHQFYHLPRIPSDPASLFYLEMKTKVIDKIHTRRTKCAHAFGTISQSPFLDLELIEFLASLSESIWASPDILPGFAQFALRSYSQPKPFTAAPSHLTTFSSWKTLPQMRALMNALKEGLLAESGFISSTWLEEQISKQTLQSTSYLYSILTLELWMRLFIDLPLAESNADIPLNDLLLIPAFSSMEHI